MSTVKFVNVNKIYDNNVQAVYDFNLEVADKEFIVLVGPSGCGKSTTLRMLAGLEDITTGQILIDDVVVNDVLPKNRDIAMVFQNYALYPHMTVYDNMAFALKMRGMKKEEIDKTVQEAAKVLALEEYLKRKPKALSGGQRQRVALGRAIVRTPKVFLMDEPLSNLDAKLRVQMRSEITRIHKKVNATTIYVTHDQTEAMTMADRIVIMKDGFIQQIGTPKEVYNFPNNMFVGGFIGSPAMNFINCEYQNGKVFIKKAEGDSIPLTLGKDKIKLLEDYKKIKYQELKDILVKIETTTSEVENELLQAETKAVRLSKTKKAQLETQLEKLKEINERYTNEVTDIDNNHFSFVMGIRPENINVSHEKDKGIELKVELSELLGHELIIYTFIADQRIIIKVPAKVELKAGDTFVAEFDESMMHMFDKDTTNRIVL